MEDFDRLLAEMTVVDPSLCYYAITLTADLEGNRLVDTQTLWVAWEDADRKIEIRKPSIVKPEAFINYWERHSQPYLIVKNDEEWLMYYFRGGNALVEETTATIHLNKVLLAGPCVQVGELGFTDLSRLPNSAHNRAPSPKLRMRVFNRDLRKCRICGRSPKDYSDVEIHTHHVRPWVDGGVTVEENLLTLCHTCHKGLEPHFDRSLYRHFPPSREESDFADSVQRHRNVVYKQLVDARQEQRRSRTKVDSKTKRADQH